MLLLLLAQGLNIHGDIQCKDVSIWKTECSIHRHEPKPEPKKEETNKVFFNSYRSEFKSACDYVKNSAHACPGVTTHDHKAVPYWIPNNVLSFPRHQHKNIDKEPQQLVNCQVTWCNSSQLQRAKCPLKIETTC